MTQDFKDSSGNVFADLGFKEEFEQELLKAKLTVQIYKLLSDSGLTQTEAARLLGTTQPQVSALMRRKPTSVSVGRLMEFLTILGQDVEVTVKPASRQDPNRSLDPESSEDSKRSSGRLSVVVYPETQPSSSPRV